MPATGLYVKPLKATLQDAEAEWRECGMVRAIPKMGIQRGI
jgi:hypothetical protein